MNKHDLDNLPLCFEYGHEWAKDNGQCERCGLFLWDVNDAGIPDRSYHFSNYNADAEINTLEELKTRLPQLTRADHVLARLPVPWMEAQEPVYQAARATGRYVSSGQESHGNWCVYHLFIKESIR